MQSDKPFFTPTRRNAFNKLDLPTFGMPTTRTRISSNVDRFAFKESEISSIWVKDG
jgi:hypothetical protein